MSELELFPEPSPSESTVFSKTTKTNDFDPETESLLTELEVDNVRITPPCMHFENAFEGKRFKQKLTIQNCGKHLAFIRFCEPNSKTFEFKSFPQGLYLSPGMKIIRTVRYTYKLALGVKRGFATMWINGNEVEYRFFVSISYAVLSIEPQVLDFGRIDAVNHATTKSFFIINSGYKGTQFAIDLGRNPLELTVDPMKGTIPAKTSVEISVEVVGSNEGEFMEEFWVKTNPPQRVVVSGIFICPKLLVRKFINSLDFTLVDFTPTYYGASSTKPILIKNFSSSSSMFCVMAEIKGKTMTLDEARKIDDNYQNFIIKPLDGRLGVLRGAVIQLSFAPVVSRRQEKPYAACFLKIIRMDCRDVESSDVQQIERVSSQTTIADSVNLITNDILLDDPTSSYPSISFEEDLAADHFSFEHSIGVCLHGEKEKAGVLLQPNIITLTDLTLEKVYHRVILVKNKSSNLPIRVKYNKVVAVEVQPHQFDLKPDKSLEVLVIIKSLNLGQAVRKITFDLLSKDFPDDHNQVMKKAGTAVIKIYVETKNVEKKENLKQCMECLPYRDLAEKLAPDKFPYRLTSTELAQKNKNDNYYLKYIRSLQKPPLPENENLANYSLTNYKLALRQNVKCKGAKDIPNKIVSYTPFIPLIPRLLYNIKITPKSIKLRKVAAFTTIIDYFHIENLNTFPIRVYLQANKSCIVFENEARHVIKSMENKKIPFSFSTNSIGRYYVNIHVLVNDSTLYEVTAVAHVVPKTLNLETHNIEFTEADGHYKFFKLINGLNAFASFDWEVPESCFKIYPQYGGIRAESYILSMITFTPDELKQYVNEYVLTSESGQKRILQVSYKKRRNAVVFDTYQIDIGVIALNVPVRKKLTLKNLKNYQVLYSIPGGVPVPGVTIEPNEGLLEGLDSQVFIIDILINAVVEFSTDIIFHIGGVEDIPIEFKGVVDYPRFKFTPDILYFRKIAPYGFDTLAFKVRNLSRSVNYLTFPVDEFPEFTVTDNEDEQFPHIEKVVLQPNQGKILFLHFHPNYICTYSLFLPYKINDILGPVNINSNATNHTNYFLRDKIANYENIAEITVVRHYPKSLPIVRVTCSAIDKTLDFSSLNINFLYFGEDHYANIVSTDFEITNTSDDVAAVCIRTDNLDYPFSLIPKDSSVEYYEVSYKVVLEPGEKVTFLAEFFPSEVGEYIIKLPLFLRHYFDDKIFNYLTLKGVYDTPTITPSTYRIDFEPVPVKLANEVQFELLMNNHFEYCEVFAETDLMGLKAIFKNGKNPELGESVLPVKIVYEGINENCFYSKLFFSCTCNAQCDITVTGVSENNLLTTHAYSHMLQNETNNGNGSETSSQLSAKSSAMYLRPEYIKQLINKNKTPYPLFPDKDDTSEYAEYMLRLKKTLEYWIFSQIFALKSYHKIPDGFSNFCKVGEARQKKRFGGVKKVKTIELPLLQLLINICGEKIKKYLSARYPTEEDDEMQWLVYTYKTNLNILNYLRNCSLHLPHVSSKFLLNYEQYVQYETYKHPERTLMDDNTFNRRSKQCWIDLFLQIIKNFFLFRTVELPNYSSGSSSSTDTKQSFSELSRQSTDDRGEYVLDVGIYGEHERELINWLQKCYDEEKNNLWQHTQPPKHKELVFLDLDLRDGLILGAVTAHYCPYVKSLINDLYTRPYNPEELHHNTCILVKAWKKLKFSYVIEPLSIQHCGMIDMLLLANYLYTILPNYYPKDTVTVHAPLTQSGIASVELENNGDDEIAYQVIFFGNTNHLFATSVDSVKLAPHEKKNVKIRYHAKSVENTTATILFSGETPGYKYGKTVAVTVLGIADVSYSCMEIPLTVDLYRPCKVTLTTQSPFKIKTNYSLYFGYQPVTKEHSNELFSWEEVKQLKTVKEFVLPDEMCHFDETGKCTSTPLICCHQIGPRDMWFYFTNPEVGDWGVKMTLTGKVHAGCYEQIELNLPKNYENLVCRCKPKPSVFKNCPLVMHLNIPMKNNLLWNARKTMLLNYVDGEELRFWSSRIFTPTGTRIMSLILNSETHPMRQSIEETVHYKIILDKPNCFVTLKNVIIDDVTSEDFYKLPIHPTKNLTEIHNCRIRLQSEDKTETRFYKIFINCDEKTIAETDLE